MLGAAAARTLLRSSADWALPVLRAYGLLTFGGSALSGFLLLVATFERREAALLGLFAVLVAQGVANLCGYARDTIASGYYGYNALLVGLALAHSEPLSIRIALLVGGGALLAALLSAVLGDLTRAAVRARDELGLAHDARAGGAPFLARARCPGGRSGAPRQDGAGRARCDRVSAE